MEQKSNKKVFLIHGFQGTPNGGWRPYLMAELDKYDIYACALSMKNPNEPQLSEWLEEIKRHVDANPNDEIYLLGHSLGGTAILRFIEQFDYKNIKGIVIASAPCHKNENEKIRTFLNTDFNWSVMKGKVQNVVVIQGSDDPHVPMSDAEEITKELDGKLIVITNGKHLNGSAGFTQLPEALSALIDMLKYIY